MTKKTRFCDTFFALFVFLTFLKMTFQLFFGRGRKNDKFVIFKYPQNSVIFYDT